MEIEIRIVVLCIVIFLAITAVFSIATFLNKDIVNLESVNKELGFIENKLNEMLNYFHMITIPNDYDFGYRQGVADERSKIICWLSNFNSKYKDGDVVHTLVKCREKNNWEKGSYGEEF